MNNLLQKFNISKEQYAHIELTDNEKAVARYNAQKAKLRASDTDYLSPDEVEEVYRLARMKMDGDLKAKAYMKVVREDKPVVNLTASQLYSELLQFISASGKIPNIYDGRGELYMNLCKYFTKDESGPYSINKNLWLEGGVGVGKTTVIKFFQQKAHDKYKMVGARELTYKFLNKEIGVKVIDEYSKRVSGLGICIDDVGTESASKSFGNEMNVVGEIIVNCYDNGVFPCHITTNLTFDQFKLTYGERAFDRVREKYNQVLFEGKSLR